MMRNPRLLIRSTGGYGRLPLRWLTSLTVLLCSCRSVPPGKMPLPPDEATLQQRAPADPVAHAVQRVEHVRIAPAPYQGTPIPVTCVTPWAPPGIAGPWPHDEYLKDGGDREVQVNIGSEGEVRGLELEDTVAIYDTTDGRTVIEPSNRLALYSPRFSAVRQVTSVVQNAQNEQLTALAQPVRAQLNREDRLASTAVQPVQPQGGIGTKQLSIQRVHERVVPTISLQPIAAVEGEFALHENFRVMRQGIFAESEQARLIGASQAAVAWSHDKAVQVVLDGRQAVAVSGDQRTQVTFAIDEPNHPRLRVIKTASTNVARPGETVDFTIRFDNLGDQAIERVVLIDNLTTRLEYVPSTAQSSRPADFSTERNEGDSLVLRWEFNDRLPPGQGGLVRFHCLVR
jgi:uncharacterized repeat protein (TIGR01451 family)